MQTRGAFSCAAAASQLSLRLSSMLLMAASPLRQSMSVRPIHLRPAPSPARVWARNHNRLPIARCASTVQEAPTLANSSWIAWALVAR